MRNCVSRCTLRANVRQVRLAARIPSGNYHVQDFVRPRLADSPGPHYMAMLHHNHLVSGLEDVFKPVRNDDYRNTMTLEPTNRLSDLGYRRGAETCSWLIHDHQAGIKGGRPRN